MAQKVVPGVKASLGRPDHEAPLDLTDVSCGP